MIEMSGEGRPRRHESLLAASDLELPRTRRILDAARSFLEVSKRSVRKVPALRGKTLLNVFFEASTRTRTSFELAGKRLSMDVVNLSGSSSSTTKGETLLDTIQTLEAMQPDIVVIRHAASGAAEYVAKRCGVPIVNAGDGTHEHPTQGLLDCLTIRRALGSIEGARIAIVGDIANSRVARSALHALTTLGAQVRLIGPPTLLPRSFGEIAQHRDRVAISHDLDANLADLDAIMMLRIQLERAAGGAIASDYRIHYGLTRERAARLPARCIVLHPGPVNRGVEVDDDVADDTRRSQILRQVTHGVAVRMAVLEAVIAGRPR